MQMAGIFAQDRTFTQPVVWVTTLVMACISHRSSGCAFFFSWKRFPGRDGIMVARRRPGHRRRIPSAAYASRLQDLPKWVEYFLTVCGTLTLEGGPIFWVATHRQHHQNTDKEGDPHSPREGGFWAHVGWLLTGQDHA
jgi:hypothetical protein